MLEKVPRALALRTMIVVSLFVCSPAFLTAAQSTCARRVLGDDEG